MPFFKSYSLCFLGFGTRNTNFELRRCLIDHFARLFSFNSQCRRRPFPIGGRATKHGALRPISPSCRSWCAMRIKRGSLKLHPKAALPVRVLILQLFDRDQRRRCQLSASNNRWHAHNFPYNALASSSDFLVCLDISPSSSIRDSKVLSMVGINSFALIDSLNAAIRFFSKGNAATIKINSKTTLLPP